MSVKSIVMPGQIEPSTHVRGGGGAGDGKVFRRKEMEIKAYNTHRNRDYCIYLHMHAVYYILVANETSVQQLYIRKMGMAVRSLFAAAAAAAVNWI